MNDKQYKKLFFKAKSFGFKKGLDENEAEDFAQEACIQASRVGAIKLDYIWLNYRDFYRADKRILSGAQGKLSGFRTISTATPLDSTNEDSPELGDTLGVPGLDVGSGDFVDEHARLFADKTDRCIFGLAYRWRLDAIEISDLFGFGPSRVSQRLKRIQGRLSARIKSERPRKTPGEVATLLRPETERNLWGVGPITFERMEIGQSWQVASFDETSF